MGDTENGCILLSRSLLDSDVWEFSPLCLKMWIWMLMKASFRDRGNLKRGQFFTSMAEMQEAFKVRQGFRFEKPTKGQLRASYGALVGNTMVDIRKSTRGMLVTILNYDKYQKLEAYGQHTAQHNGDHLGDTATTHYKQECKKDLNPLDQNPSAAPPVDVHFETFWKAYPKRVGRGAAVKAWKKIKAPASTLQLILKALAWQIDSEAWTKSNGQYIPNPATYLNQNRWLDEPQQQAEQPKLFGGTQWR